VDITLGLHLLGQEAVAAGAPPRRPHWAVGTMPVSDEEHVATARDMRARGARFVTGLDMGMTHARFDASAANARAFVRWLGYTPWQALAASTLESAESLRLGGLVGSLRPGLVADMLTVAGDPADDIAAFGEVLDVVQSGRFVKRAGRALV
jgi:imidazolonepropionase-like amidohydrolase